jgi:hypothetical protein
MVEPADMVHRLGGNVSKIDIAREMQENCG